MPDWRDEPTPECPHRPGTEDYALWWEARIKINIARESQRLAAVEAKQKRLTASSHGHVFTPSDAWCTRCGKWRGQYAGELWDADSIAEYGKPVPACPGQFPPSEAKMTTLVRPERKAKAAYDWHEVQKYIEAKYKVDLHDFMAGRSLWHWLVEHREFRREAYCLVFPEDGEIPDWVQTFLDMILAEFPELKTEAVWVDW